MTYEEVLRITNEMPLPVSGEKLEILGKIYKNEQDIAMLMIRAYNYGILQGKREERARRASK